MRTRLAILSGAAIFLLGCSAPPREAQKSALAAPIQVQTAMASVDAWPETYETTGTVEARSTTVVSAKWMGYIREMNVHLGDPVRAGQTLATLDARELDAAANRATAARAELNSALPEADNAVTAAKAHLELIEKTHQRMTQLHQERSISDQEFDESAAKLKAAQADVAMAAARRAQLDHKIAQADEEIATARVNRGYAQILSPVAGVVTTKPVEPGTLAAPGAPLLTIESGGYRLAAAIEEAKTSRVRAGSTAKVQLDGIDRTVEARVSEVVPSVDPVSRSYTAKLDLPGPAGLRSGMFGRAAFRMGERKALTVPENAIVERGALLYVFVEEGNVARNRLVTAGTRAGGRVEILSGLSAGEKVVAPVPLNLADGAPVEVRP